MRFVSVGGTEWFGALHSQAVGFCGLRAFSVSDMLSR